jgi:hypothetical protein
MTDDTKTVDALKFADLVRIIDRVEDDDAHIDLTVCGLVLRLYPSRVPAITRTRTLAMFLAALLRRVNTNTVEITLCSTPLALGHEMLSARVRVRGADDTLAAIPCDVLRLVPPSPVSIALPSADGTTTVVPLRRILL